MSAPATSQLKKDYCSDSDRYTTLLDLISQWPEWKIRSLCLDKSDLIIKAEIEKIKNRK